LLIAGDDLLLSLPLLDALLALLLHIVPDADGDSISDAIDSTEQL